MRKRNLCVLMFSLLMVCGLSSCAPTDQQANENEKTALAFLETGFKDQPLQPFFDQYCTPDIVMDLPEAFRMPTDNDNVLKGAEECVERLTAWQKETSHQMKVVSTVSQGDRVAILIRVNRIFDFDLDKNPDITYEGHLMAFFFEFRDKKIAKITTVFDVMQDVENAKAKKYANP